MRVHTQQGGSIARSECGHPSHLDPGFQSWRGRAAGVCFRGLDLNRDTLGICGRSREVENVASLCSRRKTLSPSTRLLPRVTKSSTGRDAAPDDSVGERGRSNPAFRGPPAPRVEPRVLPAPPALPAEVPTRCFQGGRTVIKSAWLQCNGSSPGGQRGARTPGTRHRN